MNLQQLVEVDLERVIQNECEMKKRIPDILREISDRISNSCNGVEPYFTMDDASTLQYIADQLDMADAMFPSEIDPLEHPVSRHMAARANGHGDAKK